MDDANGNVPAGGAIPEHLSYDDVFEVLADHRRRHLLTVLRRVETPERLSALTRSLAVATDRTGVDEVKQLRTDLYHRHIPKLEDAGLAEYDEARATVDLTRGGEALAEAIER